jgi:phospho-N-acetylmuramoyl-pentapeptide-transferase
MNMTNKFNPYKNQQSQRVYTQQPQYRMPTMNDFKKLFTKLDLFALLLIFISAIFDVERNISILINSFSVSLIFMPKFVLLMSKIQRFGQPIRSDGPQSHLSKKNTPTMGGAFIVLMGAILSMIYCDTRFVYVPIWCLIFYGVLGGYDDFLKIKKNNSKGLRPRQKLIVQLAMAAFFSVLIYYQNPDVTKIYFPFAGQVDITFWLFFPLSIFVIIGASNAFNLTDGLDGLAITQFFVTATLFIFIALGFTHHDFISNFYYNKEIARFLCVMIGTGLSFFWFNSFPAKIFMGDVGSLALGATIGVLAMMFAMPIVLIFSGMIFVVEAVSVMLQVYFFRKSDGKRRLFLMAPIHHHFEKLGIHENRITQAMLVTSIIFNLIASQI